jgi:hypothetical protein
VGRQAHVPDRRGLGALIMDLKHKCIGCGAEVDHLEVFPGPRCLACWTPIGEAEAKTMTARRLSRMWGGR